MPVETSPASLAYQSSLQNGGETTGRYLILMEPEGVEDGVNALAQRASLRLAFAGEFLRDPSGAMPISDGDGIVFEDLGVAIVNALPDRVAAVSAAVSNDSALRLVEPERVVYAMGRGTVDHSYLRGYRDAVNHLVDGILDGASLEKAIASSAYGDDTLSWGLQAMGVDRSRFTGKGIKIAILDTGLDFKHRDFASNTYVSRSFIDGIQSAQDGHGHGTHCAGLAAGPVRPGHPPRFGVAPDAEILVGKVLNDAGRGGDGGILAGIQWAIANGCQIVSMSLGAKVPSGMAHSTIFEQAAQRALGKGTVLIAAAGNDSRRPVNIAPVSHPANCPSILAVSAVDHAMQTAKFSNGSGNAGGGAIDIAGPGVDCRSAWTMPQQYKNESGTSMATPHVAGIAALIAEAEPAARGPQLVLRLLQTALRLNAPATDVGVGLAQAPQ